MADTAVAGAATAVRSAVRAPCGVAWAPDPLAALSDATAAVPAVMTDPGGGDPGAAGSTGADPDGADPGGAAATGRNDPVSAPCPPALAPVGAVSAASSKLAAAGADLSPAAGGDVRAASSGVADATEEAGAAVTAERA